MALLWPRTLPCVQGPCLAGRERGRSGERGKRGEQRGWGEDAQHGWEGGVLMGAEVADFFCDCARLPEGGITREELV